MPMFKPQLYNPQSFAGALSVAMPEAVEKIARDRGFIRGDVVDGYKYPLRTSVQIDKTSALAAGKTVFGKGASSAPSNKTDADRVRSNMETSGQIPEHEAFIVTGFHLAIATAVNDQAVARIGNQEQCSDLLYLLEQTAVEVLINSVREPILDLRTRELAKIMGFEAAATTENDREYVVPRTELDRLRLPYFDIAAQGLFIVLGPRETFTINLINGASRNFEDNVGTLDIEAVAHGYRFFNVVGRSGNVRG